MSTTKAAAEPTAAEAAHASTAPSSPLAAGLAQQLGNQNFLRLLRARMLQAKLTVSHPQDSYEQEADRVAEQVMRMPAPTTVSPVGAIQRLPDGERDVRRFSTTSDVPTVDAATEHSIGALSGRGSALPESVRSFMGSRIGADFSAVRVHDDERAHELARAVNAQAFTVGRNVVFGAGRYAPETDHGRRLLAHELTHVVQQSGAPQLLSRDKFAGRAAGHAEEFHVARVSNHVMRSPVAHTPVTNSAPRIQRDATASGARQAPETQGTDAATQVAFVRPRSGETDLNLYPAPDKNSSPLKQMEVGQRVHVLDDPNVQTGWRKIVVLGKAGYAEAPFIHFPPAALIQQDPGLRMIRVLKPGLSFWDLVKDMYGIVGNESTKDQNMNHFINAIRAVNNPKAFIGKSGGVDPLFFLSGRDAKDTQLRLNYDLWIPSFAVAAKKDVGSGTLRGELKRLDKKIEEKLADFRQAAALSIAYMPEAIESRAGEVGSGLLHGLLDFAKDAVLILAGSTAVGALIGFVFGAGAGAVPGAEIGFEIGMQILNVYGLAVLVEAIWGIAKGLLGQLGTFIGLVWNANGDKKQLDLAARALADAIGTLVSAALIAIVAYLLKKGANALAKTKFAQTVGETRLAEWVKDRQQLKTTRETKAGKAAIDTAGKVAKAAGETRPGQWIKERQQIKADKKTLKQAVKEERQRQAARRRATRQLLTAPANSPERLFQLLEQGIDRDLPTASVAGQVLHPPPAGVFRRGLKTADAAYDAYNEALARSVGREVGIFHNPETGEFSVTIGSEGAVWPPQGKWDALVHFHHVSGGKVKYRLPAPLDFFDMHMRQLRGETGFMREFVEFDIPGVGRGRTEFGINPANANEPVYVRIHRPDAPPETLTFADHSAYREYWDGFTAHAEVGSPEYKDMMRDMAIHHRDYGGFSGRTMTGSGDPPGSGDGGPKHIDDGQVEIPEPEPESSGVPAPAVPGTDTTRSFRPPVVRFPPARRPAKPPAPAARAPAPVVASGPAKPPTDGDAIPVHRPYPGDRPPNFPPPGVRRPVPGSTQLPSGAKLAPVVMSGELPSKPQAPKARATPSTSTPTSTPASRPPERDFDREAPTPPMPVRGTVKSPKGSNDLEAQAGEIKAPDDSRSRSGGKVTTGDKVIIEDKELGAKQVDSSDPPVVDPRIEEAEDFGGDTLVDSPTSALDTIFEQLGGNESGYTVKICNDETVFKSRGEFGELEDHVGLRAKQAGGALTDPPSKTVWIHESLLSAGGVTRRWGRLTVSQVVAHELGHVRLIEGGADGWDCAQASRLGADVPGLTATERQGLLEDALNIGGHTSHH